MVKTLMCRGALVAATVGALAGCGSSTAPAREAAAPSAQVAAAPTSSPATQATQATAAVLGHSVLDECLTAGKQTCDTPQQFRDAYEITPLLNHGIDGAGRDGRAARAGGNGDRREQPDQRRRERRRRRHAGHEHQPGSRGVRRPLSPAGGAHRRDQDARPLGHGGPGDPGGGAGRRTGSRARSRGEDPDPARRQPVAAEQRGADLRDGRSAGQRDLTQRRRGRAVLHGVRARRAASVARARRRSTRQRVRVLR